MSDAQKTKPSTWLEYRRQKASERATKPVSGGSWLEYRRSKEAESAADVPTEPVEIATQVVSEQPGVFSRGLSAVSNFFPDIEEHPTEEERVVGASFAPYIAGAAAAADADIARGVPRGTAVAPTPTFGRLAQQPPNGRGAEIAGPETADGFPPPARSFGPVAPRATAEDFKKPTPGPAAQRERGAVPLSDLMIGVGSDEAARVDALASMDPEDRARLSETGERKPLWEIVKQSYPGDTLGAEEQAWMAQLAKNEVVASRKRSRGAPRKAVREFKKAFGRQMTRKEAREFDQFLKTYRFAYNIVKTPIGKKAAKKAARFTFEGRRALIGAVQELAPEHGAFKGASVPARIATGAFRGAASVFDAAMFNLGLDGTSIEDDSFVKTLMAAREGGDPISPDSLPWYQGAAITASEMVAPMVTGVGAAAAGTAVGGPGAGFLAASTFWGTQIFPDEYVNLREAGMSEGEAALVGAVSAALQGAAENIKINPFKGPAAAVAKRSVRRFAQEAFKSYGRELSEEAVQAVIHKTAESLAGNMEAPAAEIFMEAVGAVEESAAPLLVLMAPGAAVSGIREIGDYRRSKRVTDESVMSAVRGLVAQAREVSPPILPDASRPTQGGQGEGVGFAGVEVAPEPIQAPVRPEAQFTPPTESAAETESGGIKGFHTIVEGGFGFGLIPQRGSGTYIALDRPFKGDAGEVRSAVVTNIRPDQILDPNGVFPGTNAEKSIADQESVITRIAAEHNRKGKGDVDVEGYYKDIRDAYRRLGYRAEAGEIDPGLPDGGRELVVWDRENVTLGDPPATVIQPKEVRRAQEVREDQEIATQEGRPVEESQADRGRDVQQAAEARREARQPELSRAEAKKEEAVARPAPPQEAIIDAQRGEPQALREWLSDNDADYTRLEDEHSRLSVKGADAAQLNAIEADLAAIEAETREFGAEAALKPKKETQDSAQREKQELPVVEGAPKKAAEKTQVEVKAEEVVGRPPTAAATAEPTPLGPVSKAKVEPAAAQPFKGRQRRKDGHVIPQKGDTVSKVVKGKSVTGEVRKSSLSKGGLTVKVPATTKGGKPRFLEFGKNGGTWVVKGDTGPVSVATEKVEPVAKAPKPKEAKHEQAKPKKAEAKPETSRETEDAIRQTVEEARATRQPDAGKGDAGTIHERDRVDDPGHKGKPWTELDATPGDKAGQLKTLRELTAKESPTLDDVQSMMSATGGIATALRTSKEGREITKKIDEAFRANTVEHVVDETTSLYILKESKGKVEVKGKAVTAAEAVKLMGKTKAPKSKRKIGDPKPFPKKKPTFLKLPKVAADTPKARASTVKGATTTPHPGEFATDKILVGGNDAVATDGARLHHVRLPSGHGIKPGLYGDLSLRATPTKVDPKKGVRFPRWQESIPTHKGKVGDGSTFDIDIQKTLHDASRGALLIGEGSFPAFVLLSNPDGSIGFATQSLGRGQAEISAKPGAKAQIAVNPDFLIDALVFLAENGATRATLRLAPSDTSNKPIHLVAGKAQAVVMPTKKSLGLPFSGQAETIEPAAKAAAKPAPKVEAPKAKAPEADKPKRGFTPDPVVKVPAGKTTRKAFASTQGPPPPAFIGKPFLTAERVESPDKGIQDMFDRTDRMRSPRNKLRRAAERVKAGASERFLTTHGFPNTPEAAFAKDAVRTMPEQARAAKQRAVDDIVKIMDGDGSRQVLSTEGLDLLSKKVFTDDLVTEAKRARDAGKAAEARLPNGVTEAALVAEQKRLDTLIEKIPSVKDALRLHRDLWRKVSLDLANRGVISEENAKNETYVRHLVLDFITEDAPRGGSPRGRLKPSFRGYALGRKGTARDISTDYLEVQLKALGDIRRDNSIDDMATDIGKHYAKPLPNSKDGETIDGYVLWQYKRGNIMFAAKSITEAQIARIAGDVNTDPAVAAGLKIPASALRDSLVMGGKRKQLYIPDWLAAKLDNLPVSHGPGKIASWTVPITQIVKRWYLRTNPVRYNLRNALGDAERVNASGRTRAFKEIPSAVKMLDRHSTDSFTLGGREFSGEEVYQAGVSLGVYRSSLWHEMGEARKHKEFERFERVSDASGFRKAARAAKWLPSKASRIGQSLQDVTQFREDILRAAVYLDAIRDVNAFLETGKAIRHWAGSQSDIHALAKSDPLRAAAKISRETLVDYGDFTPWENDVLRNGLIPFYSWMKKNATFWPRVIKNAAAEGKGARPWLAATPKVGYTIGKWAMRIGAAYGLLALWNRQDEEYAAREDALPAYLRLRPHILLPNGGYLGSPTALSDFTEWFGLDTILPDLRRWENNQITMGEVLTNAAKTEAQEPVNRVYQALNPFLKTPVKLFGLRTFPDVFEPRIYAKAFSSKAVGDSVLDILGGDVRRFLDANSGKRSLRDVLSYYFSGSSYQPLPPEELERRILRSLSFKTYKKTTKGKRKGRAHKGKQREVDILRNRLGALNRVPRRTGTTN